VLGTGVGNGGTALVSCKGHQPHRVLNRRHRRLERRPKSPSRWAPVVNDELWLMRGAFGQRGSVAGSRSRVSGLGKGRKGRWRRDRRRRDKTRPKMELREGNGVVFNAYYIHVGQLYTVGHEAPMRQCTDVDGGCAWPSAFLESISAQRTTADGLWQTCGSVLALIPTEPE
jgi:hypothetical protein